MRVLLAAAALTLLSGCASTDSQSRPASIGGGPNNLRRAPCACLEIKQDQRLPAFLNGSEQTETAFA
jgi:type IV pilus biogenesis protein CpaD/CtpE